MALLLNIARNITYSNRDVLKGKWQSFYQLPYLGFDIYNKTLGIIGLGQIGTAFARRAINGFNMKTYYWSRTRKIDVENVSQFFSTNFFSLLIFSTRTK